VPLGNVSIQETERKSMILTYLPQVADKEFEALYIVVIDVVRNVQLVQQLAQDFLVFLYEREIRR
jgi:metal-sulfur cluster biosynthetic enzyme